jgi:cellulose synthase/poly-beta-1,6-N-acetylglucosamine synthase-like glycosyltransferase
MLGCDLLLVRLFVVLMRIMFRKETFWRRGFLIFLMCVGAVQGRIYVLNERESWITRIVTLERIGGYRVSQYARDKLGLVPQYAGTVGLIRRNLLLRFGGFDQNFLAEDTELTFRNLLEGYRVKYVNEAVSGEEAVISLRQYWAQRGALG